jgi:hypothetical protein
MMKWLKKLVSGKGNSPTPPPPPNPLLDGLATMLEGVDSYGGKAARVGLADDLGSFVVSGEPSQVLGELASRPDLAEHFRLVWAHSDKPANAGPFLTHLGEASPELLARWGKAMVAMLKAHRVPWSLTIEGDRRWLEAILMQSLAAPVNGYSGSEVPRPRGLTAGLLEAALVADGAAANAWLHTLFTTPVEHYGYTANRLLALTKLPDFAESLHRHRDAVRLWLRPAELEQRLHCLKVLMNAQVPTLEAFADPLVAHALSGSKQVRVIADMLVLWAGAATAPLLRTTAGQGTPDERRLALQLLAQIGKQRGDDELAAWVRTTAAADKAASVRALVDELTTKAAAEAAPRPAELTVALPTIDWRVEATPALEAALAKLWREIDTSIAKHNDAVAAAKAAGRPHWGSPQPAIPKLTEVQLREWLLDGHAGEPEGDDFRRRKQGGWHGVRQALWALATTADLSPVTMAKVLAFFGELADHQDLEYPAPLAFEAMHARTGHPTLLELQAIVTGLGGPPHAVLKSYTSSWHAIGKDWPAEHVWPLIAHQLDVVLGWLRTPPRTYSFEFAALYRGLGTLPALPPEAVNRLFDVALGTGKTERPLAQRALANVPDKEARIAKALADGKAEVRTVAATWLGVLRHQPAVAALEQAIAKEKNDVTRGALLDALEALGCPIEKYLDREALAKDAQRGLQKGLPKELAWLPVDALPTVTWRDGTAVPRDVLVWLCVQASKAKSPEPNVLLRKYASMMQPAAAEAFAQFVLETWLHEDVAPIAADVAASLAAQQAAALFQQIRQYPQYHTDDPNRDLTVDELQAKYLPAFLRQPRGSAIASKGVLAVVAAAGGARVAAPVGRYLKEWFGSRAAQGKALIAMLAWVDHPTAIQLMLSVGNRFRTKSFQEEAMKQAQALAERRGWTIDQLADRTMPSAGFDERLVLELSYGPRTFTAHLQADLSIELRNPDGKKIASLPEPRSDDDAELAKAAKKALSAAKKELKTIHTLQSDRLYEAMCTGRDWSASDWTTFLLPHPVVRLLLQRLVWIEVGADGSERLFRPLDDGTLTDVDDEPLELRADARVKLAHDSCLDAERIGAWQRHLADYEVKPLFQQLGKGTYQLPADKARTMEIDDFRGHLLESFALRGRAGKLGYVRGQAQDAGWFVTYEKRFPTLGITAVITFTGNPLPETNRTVALETLGFRRKLGDREMDLALGEVPAVLLSECWQDLRACAAEGPGFDPDWQKKSEYR